MTDDARLQNLARLLDARDRLERHRYTLGLYLEHDGWRWDVREKPIHTRRIFATVTETLNHADEYTRFWYPGPDDPVRPIHKVTTPQKHPNRPSSKGDRSWWTKPHRRRKPK